MSQDCSPQKEWDYYSTTSRQLPVRLQNSYFEQIKNGPLRNMQLIFFYFLVRVFSVKKKLCIEEKKSFTR